MYSLIIIATGKVIGQFGSIQEAEWEQFHSVLMPCQMRIERSESR